MQTQGRRAALRSYFIFPLMLFIVLVAFPLTPVSGQQRANEDSIIQLLKRFPVGKPTSRLEILAGQLGYQVEHFEWQDKRAMSRGLLKEPALLEQLNRAEVAHPLFDGLPQKGPTFLRLTRPGVDIVFASIQGEIWAVALSFKLTAAKEISPFDKNRVAHIRRQFRSIESLCREMKIEKGSHGTPRVFRGRDCAGGNMVARFEPTLAYPLRLVIYTAAP